MNIFALLTILALIIAIILFINMPLQEMPATAQISNIAQINTDTANVKQCIRPWGKVLNDIYFKVQPGAIPRA